MVKYFRKKLKQDGRSLTWFHKKYLFGKRGYTSFAQQAGGFVTLQEDVENAIKKYLKVK